MDIGLAPAAQSLESRYAELDRPVLMTGIQALVRVLLERSRLDRAAGHHTAGLVSGYRGSPLGGLDLELWRRKAILDAHDIRFQPGLNEDLGATMLWGAQLLDAFPGKRVDGVFGMWYGKGPGVDRSGDALRCANMMGTSTLGGMLAVAGDDHGAQSSVYPHQTDHIFHSVMMPVLAPAGVQDIIDFGLAGFALSRFSGVWTALKLTSETAEQGATITVGSEREYATPDFAVPAHGLNYDPTMVFPRDRAELERRMLLERIPAVLAWARANPLDRLVSGAPDAAVGIVTVGKAHADAVHALRMLGLDGDARLALYKVGLTWPIEADGLRDFARGKRVLLVVEEKRSIVKSQLRDALYNMPADARPLIVGKQAVDGSPLLPAVMEFCPEDVAAAIVRTMRHVDLGAPEAPAPFTAEHPPGLLTRIPAFCAGCPHGTSTKVPEGSFANAGIGCHFLATAEDPNTTRTFSHMGGEGIGWVGMAPFTDVPHMFVNLGDGTYTHSGILAIRQAIAAKANLTYKILFNDAVAMTGGQPAEGAPSVPMIAAQVAAEGAARVVVVADDVSRLPPASALPKGVGQFSRDDLDRVQREMRDTKGVTVIIYDQVCATEKRRRRKRGKMAQATRHPLINAEVCENCGDCSVQSSCIAIDPVETPLGRKRRINPTSCNVDLSCLKGYCPSFVTVDGPPRAPSVDPHWKDEEAALAQGLGEPDLRTAALPWRGLFAGIGGGGIVTAGAILAQAANIEGWDVSTLDFTGLAQKNGAVVSHVQIGLPNSLDVVRIPSGHADVMIAADLAVAAGPGVLERVRPAGTVVGNLDLAATAAFKKDPALSIDAALHRRAIEKHARGNANAWLHAEQIAETLFGQAQALNTVLLGFAWQRGLIPVGSGAILRAIELNGASVEMNKRAFLWGRILADKPEMVARVLGNDAAKSPPPHTLADLVESRAGYLAQYQNRGWADLYRARVQDAVAAETAAVGRAGRFARAAAEGWFRAMSYKDEYEVARLHAEAPSFGAKPKFHMAPPLIGRVDPATGRRRKVAIPGWLALPVFRALRHGKVLRGTPLDLFGLQEDRRMERALIAQYEADMRAACEKLRADNLDAAVAIASIPDAVRGFGSVKMANWRRAQESRPGFLAALDKRMIAAAAA